MRHVPIIVAILVAAVLAPVAASADRMWVGFHDDPVLRYDADRQSEIEVATATNNASILRTLVTWADVAPTKPANAADPFDPAYRFDDLDEFVRNAQAQRRRGPDHALGHTEMGERQQERATTSRSR